MTSEVEAAPAEALPSASEALQYQVVRLAASYPEKVPHLKTSPVTKGPRFRLGAEVDAMDRLAEDHGAGGHAKNSKALPASLRYGDHQRQRELAARSLSAQRHPR